MRTSWVKVSLLAGLMVVVASTGTLGAPRKDGRPKGTKPGVARRADREAYPRDGKGADTDRRRAGTAGISPADQVIADDLIVQASLCVGFDCVLDESFGFDTVRLKENNLRIAFQDTSSTAGFPSNDWELTANDSASGGENRFSITDVTGAMTPFTVEAGARNAALVVDSTDRIGIGTSSPVLDVHVTTSNTPGQRLEQTAAGGFTAQTWDIAGNEANFFVRDVTSGSRLPFRIRPGAPTSSIDIAADGDVGIGTASPDKALHLAGSDPRVIRLQRTGATNPNIWDIGDLGDGSFKIDSGSTTWFEAQFTNQGMFRLRPVGSPPTEQLFMGAMYNDQSKALCWYDGSAWLKVVGSGTCQ
jgi:hypothetical protein